MASTLVSITAEANLQSFICPLTSHISSVQGESSANQTNVSKKGPPTAINWQGQQQKPKPAVGLSNQHQNQFDSSGAQAPGSGQNKPKLNKQKK